MDSMGRTFDVVVEQDEDGMFVASVPAMPGCLTQGSSLDEARANIREAMQLWIEAGHVPREGIRVVGVEHVSVES